MTTDFVGHNVLCTCQSWFVGPDGKQYKAIWGNLKAVHEAGKTMGFIPNRSHANWFYEIGNSVIMGCQVLYMIKCEAKPNVEPVKDWQADATNGLKEYERTTFIYLAQ